ncbi:MAG: metal ABC transporter permease [Verrucomicrobia bacterium]|nr:metal ABC transporter permease [Verrucomicrobiota bacterium]
MLQAFFSHPFLHMSFLAGIAASITSGIVGSYVVVKRIVFISGSIAHSVLGGMGIFLWLKRTYDIAWMNPLHGALLFAILSAFLIGWIHLKHKQREDTVIAAIWSTGMAIGVIFVSLTPGYNVELMNFLFGNILWTSMSDLILLFSLAGLVLLSALLFHTKFQAVCFDENQARLRGISVTKYYLFLLTLVAISVVILIQVVGAILIIAMLAIPAAIAGTFSPTLSRTMGWAVVLGCIFTSLGLTLSYFLNWPPGATIALTAAAFYLLNLLRR